MTQQRIEKLLYAYRTAIEEGRSEIADLLEDVILEEMGYVRPTPAELQKAIEECLPDVSPV